MKKLLAAVTLVLAIPAAFAQMSPPPGSPATGVTPPQGTPPPGAGMPPGAAPPPGAGSPNVPRMAPPGPDQMRQMMEMQMGSMIPIIARLGEALIEAQLAAAEKPETAKKIVTFKKNVYDGLVKQGFTKEQALAITVATQPPMANPVLR